MTRTVQTTLWGGISEAGTPVFRPIQPRAAIRDMVGPVGVPFQVQSEESEAAAKAIRKYVSRLEWLTSQYLYQRPLTDEELDATIHAAGQRTPTLRPRRIALTEGKLSDDGTRSIRPALVERMLIDGKPQSRETIYGNKATVWQLSAAGVAYVKERREMEAP